MNRLVKLNSLTVVLIMLLWHNADAQITSSPYSVFGLGSIEGNSMGPSKAMGGTGIAFQSDMAINFLNPASYSGLDSLVSIFELGLFSRYTNYQTKTDNQSLINANLKYIVMGFRITPWMSTSFGFAPYSSVGYNINTIAEIEGTTQKYTKKFEGEGGVNQVYLGSSVRLIKNLSAGINLAYLFGNITNTESSETFYYSLQNISYLSNLTLNYGLNYRFAVKNWNFALGLIYNNSKTLQTNNELTIKTDYSDETLTGRTRDLSIPRHFGAGISVSGEFFRAGFDFERSLWSNVNFDNPLLRTRNTNRYSFGLEVPSPGRRKGTSRMIFYRLGAEYRESYMIIRSKPINYSAITLGAGMPLAGALSVLNLSLELGQNGTLASGLFRENFVTVHIDMALRDLWFRKKRYL